MEAVSRHCFVMLVQSLHDLLANFYSTKKSQLHRRGHGTAAEHFHAENAWTAERARDVMKLRSVKKLLNCEIALLHRK